MQVDRLSPHEYSSCLLNLHGRALSAYKEVGPAFSPLSSLRTTAQLRPQALVETMSSPIFRRKIPYGLYFLHMTRLAVFLLSLIRPVRLGNSGLKISRIILGCMSYGTFDIVSQLHVPVLNMLFVFRIL